MLIWWRFTFSSFSKASARRGTQPWMASPATALSHAGQPAATCSPCTYLWRFPNLKLSESQLELVLPDSPTSLWLPPPDSVLFLLLFFSFRSDSPKGAALLRNAPEWSIAGVTDTACLELTHPMDPGRILDPIQIATRSPRYAFFILLRRNKETKQEREAEQSKAIRIAKRRKWVSSPSECCANCGRLGKRDLMRRRIINFKSFFLNK